MAGGEILEVGRVLAAFGIKGWVKVFSDTDPPQNIIDYRPWFFLRGGNWQEVEVLEAQEHGKGVVARLRDVEDRNAAEALTGTVIGIKIADLPDLLEGEFYWRDLIGLKVVNQKGELLGEVSELLETGANDVIVVSACEGSIDGTRRLIPWVFGQVVQRVRKDEGSILVDWDQDW